MLQPSSAPFTLFSSVQCSACSNNFFNDKWILQLVSTDTLVNVSVCRGEILNFSSELIMLNWLLYRDSEAVVLPSQQIKHNYGVCVAKRRRALDFVIGY